jgi:DNA-3-methyladenine glycosylase I
MATSVSSAGSHREIERRPRSRRVAAVTSSVRPDAARCPWAQADPVLAAYHDHERGRFPASEARLFEALSLDVLQRGTPWRDVLRRRDEFDRAFCGFDPDRVAAVDEAAVGRISQALGLHGHDGRVRAVAQNARRLISARAEWGSGRDDSAAFASWLRSTAPSDIVVELAERFRCVSVGSARNFVEAIGRVPLGHDPACWRAHAVVVDLACVLDGAVDRRNGAVAEDRHAIRALAVRHPLAVIGAAPAAAIHAALGAVGMSEAFEVIVGTDDASAGAPAPDRHCAAAARLALRPTDCVAIEIGEDGIRGARAAGMAAVLLGGTGSAPDGAIASCERIADVDPGSIFSGRVGSRRATADGALS